MAMDGIINIVLSLIFIGLSFWAIQCIRLEVFLKRPQGAQAKTLQVFISIALGHLVATFFSDYFGWTVLLKQLFTS
ncbi:MAG TPA: DUF1146 domain-containing protein [Paenibacillaceae bacterium]|nr:DUF1146 domain-containing protein [Paenibacillaceae bacterium]